MGMWHLLINLVCKDKLVFGKQEKDNVSWKCYCENCHKVQLK